MSPALFLEKEMKERLFKYMNFTAAFLSVVFLFGIIFSIFSEGLPVFAEIGVFEFLFGTSWHPVHYPPEMGILPLIVSSLVVTAGALIISLPLGVGSAIYLSEIAKPGVREALKPFVELLAGIPSVIYGLFGMAFLAPFIRKLFDIPTGLNALSASIVLGIMVTPIISSIAEDALSSVPKNLREASLALGANKSETIFRVVLPAAKSGVIAGVILGFGRAIGETMVVLMVAGGSPGMIKSILRPVRPMTAAIASEMGETIMGSLHYRALFGIAIVLFIITFASNLITQFILEKGKRQ